MFFCFVLFFSWACTLRWFVLSFWFAACLFLSSSALISFCFTLADVPSSSVAADSSAQQNQKKESESDSPSPSSSSDLSDGGTAEIIHMDSPASLSPSDEGHEEMVADAGDSSSLDESTQDLLALAEKYRWGSDSPSSFFSPWSSSWRQDVFHHEEQGDGGAGMPDDVVGGDRVGGTEGDGARQEEEGGIWSNLFFGADDGFSSFSSPQKDVAKAIEIYEKIDHPSAWLALGTIYLVRRTLQTPNTSLHNGQISATTEHFLSLSLLLSFLYSRLFSAVPLLDSVLLSSSCLSASLFSLPSLFCAYLSLSFLFYFGMGERHDRHDFPRAFKYFTKVAEAPGTATVERDAERRIQASSSAFERGKRIEQLPHDCSKLKKGKERERNAEQRASLFGCPSCLDLPSPGLVCSFFSFLLPFLLRSLYSLLCVGLLLFPFFFCVFLFIFLSAFSLALCSFFEAPFSLSLSCFCPCFLLFVSLLSIPFLGNTNHSGDSSVGRSEAHYFLGFMYQLGLGTPQSNEKVRQRSKQRQALTEEEIE